MSIKHMKNLPSCVDNNSAWSGHKSLLSIVQKMGLQIQFQALKTEI